MGGSGALAYGDRRLPKSVLRGLQIKGGEENLCVTSLSATPMERGQYASAIAIGLRSIWELPWLVSQKIRGHKRAASQRLEHCCGRAGRSFAVAKQEPVRTLLRRLIRSVGRPGDIRADPHSKAPAYEADRATSVLPQLELGRLADRPSPSAGWFLFWLGSFRLPMPHPRIRPSPT